MLNHLIIFYQQCLFFKGFKNAETVGNLYLGPPLHLAKTQNRPISFLTRLQALQIANTLDNLVSYFDRSTSLIFLSLQKTLKNTFVYDSSCMGNSLFSKIKKKGDLLELLAKRKKTIRTKRDVALSGLYTSFRNAAPNDKPFLAQKIYDLLEKKTKPEIINLYMFWNIEFNKKLAKQGLLAIFPLHLKNKFNIEINQYKTTRSRSRNQPSNVGNDQNGDPYSLLDFSIAYMSDQSNPEETKLFWAEKVYTALLEMNARDISDLFSTKGIEINGLTDKDELIELFINYIKNRYNVQLPPHQVSITVRPTSAAPPPTDTSEIPTINPNNWPTDLGPHRESILIEEDSDRQTDDFIEDSFSHWTNGHCGKPNNMQLAIQGRKSFYLLKDEHLNRLSEDVSAFIENEIEAELSILMDSQCQISESCNSDEVLDQDERYMKISDRTQPPDTLTPLENEVLNAYNLKTAECTDRLDRHCRGVNEQENMRVELLESGLAEIRRELNTVIQELTQDNIKELKEVKQEDLKKAVHLATSINSNLQTVQGLQKVMREEIDALTSSVGTLQQNQKVQSGEGSNIKSIVEKNKKDISSTVQTILDIQTKLGNLRTLYEALETQFYQSLENEEGNSKQKNNNLGTDNTDFMSRMDKIKVDLEQQIANININSLETQIEQIKARIYLSERKLKALESLPSGRLTVDHPMNMEHIEREDSETFALFLDQYTDTLLDEYKTDLYDLIKSEVSLSTNTTNNRVFYLIENSCSIKNIKAIRNIKENEYLIFYDPSIYYQLIPREIQTDSFVFSLDKSVNYGYTSDLENSKYCNNLIRSNDFNYCESWISEHSCMHATISNQRDNCFFDSKMRTTYKRPEFNHFVCSNYCYFITTKSKVTSAEITEENIEKLEKYFLAQDTLVAEIKYLQVNNDLSIFEQLEWTDNLAIISIVIGAINIAFIIILSITRLGRKFWIYYRYKNRNSDEKIAERHQMSVRRVHFSAIPQNVE